MLRTEGHLVGPDNDPGYFWLNLSTSHYWNVLRLDFGNADVSGIFSYTQSTDGDIIHTENDSVVLLYRTNALDEWHTIPYTFEGNWKLGRFTVDDLQTGQYTLAAIDKSLLATNEISSPTLRIYPNPTKNTITVEMPYYDVSTNKYRITNLMGQTLMTGVISTETSHYTTINVSSLPTGTYFLTINGITQKFIIQ